MAKYYQYPQTLKSKEQAGHHYLLIDSYESKNAIASGNQVSSIALYIPPNSLQYSHGANYEGLDQGALFGAAGGKVRDIVGQGGGLKEIVAAGMGGGSAEAARARGIVGLVNAASKLPGTGGNAPAVLSATAGVAVNNHMALVYRGPNSFRSHTFNFSFFPKNEPESEIVKSIIRDLKNGMLPRYTGAGNTNGRLSSPFFKMPRHYKLYIKNLSNKNTYLDSEMFPTIKKNGKDEKIKHVITNMTVNHDPNGVVSLHANGAPVQTNLTLTLQETEFVTSEDSVDSSFEQNLSDRLANQAQIEENRAQLSFTGASNPGDRSRSGSIS